MKWGVRLYNVFGFPIWLGNGNMKHHKDFITHDINEAHYEAARAHGRCKEVQYWVEEYK